MKHVSRSFGLTAEFRGPRDHINMSILHSGSEAQGTGESKNIGLQDPGVFLELTWSDQSHHGSFRNDPEFQKSLEHTCNWWPRYLETTSLRTCTAQPDI